MLAILVADTVTSQLADLANISYSIYKILGVVACLYMFGYS